MWRPSGRTKWREMHGITLVPTTVLLAVRLTGGVPVHAQGWVAQAQVFQDLSDDRRIINDSDENGSEHGLRPRSREEE